MGELISEERFSCPYCAEPISLVVDFSGGSQTYIEDCQVCCQPMEVTVAADPDGHRSLRVTCAD